MLYVIKMALRAIERNGIHGDNHFYIRFLTNHNDVKIPNELKAQYPIQMTIIIQYDFKNLCVFDDYFQVSLSFNGRYGNLLIPYKRITNFADPSEGFELELRQNTVDVKNKELLDVKSHFNHNSIVRKGNVISLKELIKSEH